MVGNINKQELLELYSSEKMFRFLNMEFFEEFGILGGLITVQFLYAAYGIVVGYIMSTGISPLFLIISGNLATSLLFFPISVYIERKHWPQTFTFKLLVQFLLISLAGVALFQGLMLYGLEKTSPALASVMPNLAPGFIFVIASVFRFEKVDMRCYYSRIKILGTLICIFGAILMSTMNSNISSSVSMRAHPSSRSWDQDRVVGILCLLAGVTVLSFNYILQAATLRDFPAPVSLNAITAFIGAIFTVILQLMTEGRLEIDSPVLSVWHLIGFSLLGSITSGVCASFSIWSMQRKGPVFVSMFSPVGTVFSVILSALSLGSSLSVASLIGMFLMFAGLYSVLWAKKQEDIGVEDYDEQSPALTDLEKPLLS